jgi:hypothetical protein
MYGNTALVSVCLFLAALVSYFTFTFTVTFTDVFRIEQVQSSVFRTLLIAAAAAADGCAVLWFRAAGNVGWVLGG